MIRTWHTGKGRHIGCYCVDHGCQCQCQSKVPVPVPVSPSLHRRRCARTKQDRQDHTDKTGGRHRQRMAEEEADQMDGRGGAQATETMRGGE